MLKFSRSVFTAVILVMVFLLSAKAQLSTQRKQLFDYDWKFFLGDEPTANASNYNDKNWRILDLPHDWSIESKLDKSNPSGGDGGFFNTGIGWYRKTFRTPAIWKGKRLSIYFEGVYMNAEVFINGKSLGIHPYGYSAFTYDLTPYINQAKENTIAVRVDNSKQKNSRWYSGSGIYRHVWLVETNPVHIATWGTAITTPEVSVKIATVQVKTVVKNETGITQNFKLKTNLSVMTNKSAGAAEIMVSILPESEKEITQTIPVLNPLLWTPERPRLYQAGVQIIKNKQIIDDTKTNFGIRSIKFSTDNGFQLNGKTVQLNGGCVHHDNVV